MESKSVLYGACRRAYKRVIESRAQWAGSDHPDAFRVVRLHEEVYKDLAAAYRAAGGRRQLWSIK